MLFPGPNRGVTQALLSSSGPCQVQDGGQHGVGHVLPPLEQVLILVEVEGQALAWLIYLHAGAGSQVHGWYPCHQKVTRGWHRCALGPTTLRLRTPAAAARARWLHAGALRLPQRPCIPLNHPAVPAARLIVSCACLQ